MGDVEELRFHRPGGGTVVWQVEMDSDATDETRNFVTKRGRYRDYQLAIRYAVGGESAELALENAIATGLRMLRRFDADRRLPWDGSGSRYPWHLSQLFGYDVDQRRPFAVTVEWGVPVDRLPVPLSSPDDQQEFARGLIRGLVLLEHLGISHRQLRANTLYWHSPSRTLQINRFEYARLIGEPRTRLAQVATPAERTPREWAPPEQILGGGVIDARDDLYSAGCALLSVTPNRLHIGPGGNPDIAASNIPWLGQILHGVFDPLPGRPSAEQVLRRLGVVLTQDELPRSEPDPLAEGRRAFEQLMIAKGQGLAAPPSPRVHPTAEQPTIGRITPTRPTNPGGAAGLTDPETPTQPPPTDGSPSARLPRIRRRDRR
ncbi:Protein kinase domain-containing protein [Frankia sp. AiPs1]|uniref:hypothetical protein n=1 Tax=Frankia sp. AiPa1 TaxID=573492 RepID=UPI00202AC74B|nr:hypothetical protein [Frankia sp. AiPa1]MCL9760500.1 hypothetical protein [Frankia sp. AiPa1]